MVFYMDKKSQMSNLLAIPKAPSEVKVMGGTDRSRELIILNLILSRLTQVSENWKSFGNFQLHSCLARDTVFPCCSTWFRCCNFWKLKNTRSRLYRKGLLILHYLWSSQSLVEQSPRLCLWCTPDVSGVLWGQTVLGILGRARPMVSEGR